MKTLRRYLALPFVLVALAAVPVILIGVAVMSLFGGLANLVEGK